jgi:hypothetical protein
MTEQNVIKRKEVIGGWRKLHSEEFNDLYSSSNITKLIKSRRMRPARNIACVGEKENAYRILVKKAERRKPCGMHRHKWVGNIKLDL